MKKIIPLKQGDPKWRNKKLGTGTIGDRGCTCTCLAMLAGTTPDKIVDEAQFTAGGAIYWQTLKSLKFIWRGYKYENDRVLKAIKDYGGCLVQFKSPQASGGKHWCLFIGDGRMIDPLTGRENRTSKYGNPTGYCILEPLQTTNNDMSKELQVCLKDRKKFWKERDQAIQDLEKCKQSKAEMGEKVREARESLEKKKEKIGELNNSNSGLQGEITKKKKRINNLEVQVKDLEEKLVNQPIVNLDKKIIELVAIYLLPTAGLTYLSIYLTRIDPEAAVAIAPVINLVIFILKQQAEKLMLKLGLKRSKKSDK
ncbi:MAG: hypothetical protein U9O78_02700 [Patescibacteria group bacterium]|nr:hypothetical protein [Patescibacteria group bacterium]